METGTGLGSMNDERVQQRNIKPNHVSTYDMNQEPRRTPLGAHYEKQGFKAMPIYKPRGGGWKSGQSNDHESNTTMSTGLNEPESTSVT